MSAFKGVSWEETLAEGRSSHPSNDDPAAGDLLITWSPQTPSNPNPSWQTFVIPNLPKSLRNPECDLEINLETKTPVGKDSNSNPATSCPFRLLHRSALASEFLHCPLYINSSDQTSKNLFSEVPNQSDGLPLKIQFLVNNLKDCSGIWPQLFLQKLSSLITLGDPTIVKLTLAQDNFFVLTNLINYYANESRCILAFRCWCIFYNIFQRNLLPCLPSHLIFKLTSRLEKDFAMASKSQCHCALESSSGGKSSGHAVPAEDDFEHKVISSSSRLKIVTVLMTFAVSKCDIFICDFPPVDTRFIKDHVIPVYTDLFDPISQNGGDSDGDFLKDAILNLLIACQAVSQDTSLFSSAVEVMFELGCLSVAVQMKDKLLNLLSDEIDAFKNGSPLVIGDPTIHLKLETVGVHGVMKCLSSVISNLEYSILSREEMTGLLKATIELQAFVAKINVWNDVDENTYLECRQLQGSLEKKLGLVATHLHFVESDLDTSPDDGGILMKPIQPEFPPSSPDSQEGKLFHNGSNVAKTTPKNWAPSGRKNYVQNEFENVPVYRRKKSVILRWASAAVLFLIGCVRCGDRK